MLCLKLGPDEQIELGHPLGPIVLAFAHAGRLGITLPMPRKGRNFGLSIPDQGSQHVYRIDRAPAPRGGIVLAFRVPRGCEIVRTPIRSDEPERMVR